MPWPQQLANDIPNRKATSASELKFPTFAHIWAKKAMSRAFQPAWFSQWQWAHYNKVKDVTPFN